MRYRSGRLSMLVLALALASAGACFAQQETVYAVTHVDTLPNATAPGAPTAAQILTEFAAATRKEPGCVRFELLQQSDRGNHFTLVGVWRNQKAFDEHEAATHTKAFRAKIQPIMGSPFDERLHRLLR